MTTDIFERWMQDEITKTRRDAAEAAAEQQDFFRGRKQALTDVLDEYRQRIASQGRLTIEELQAIQNGSEIEHETTQERRIYKLIRGHEAKNFDGTAVNWQAGTPNGECLVMQEERINKETGRRRFSNWW